MLRLRRFLYSAGFLAILSSGITDANALELGRCYDLSVQSQKDEANTDLKSESLYSLLFANTAQSELSNFILDARSASGMIILGTLDGAVGYLASTALALRSEDPKDVSPNLICILSKLSRVNFVDEYNDCPVSLAEAREAVTIPMVDNEVTRLGDSFYTQIDKNNMHAKILDNPQAFIEYGLSSGQFKNLDEANHVLKLISDSMTTTAKLKSYLTSTRSDVRLPRKSCLLMLQAIFTAPVGDGPTPLLSLWRRDSGLGVATLSLIKGFDTPDIDFTWIKYSSSIKIEQSK